MSQLDRTAESLEDTWMSLSNEWQSARDVWLDANRLEFENSFWIEIEQTVKKTLEGFQRFVAAAERAQHDLES